jgi:hypothetical protein
MLYGIVKLYILLDLVLVLADHIYHLLLFKYLALGLIGVIDLILLIDIMNQIIQTSQPTLISSWLIHNQIHKT